MQGEHNCRKKGRKENDCKSVEPLSYTFQNHLEYEKKNEINEVKYRLCPQFTLPTLLFVIFFTQMHFETIFY